LKIFEQIPIENVLEKSRKRGSQGELHLGGFPLWGRVVITLVIRKELQDIVPPLKFF
jgi:hypothetical protein